MYLHSYRIRSQKCDNRRIRSINNPKLTESFDFRTKMYLGGLTRREAAGNFIPGPEQNGGSQGLMSESPVARKQLGGVTASLFEGRGKQILRRGPAVFLAQGQWNSNKLFICIKFYGRTWFHRFPHYIPMGFHHTIIDYVKALILGADILKSYHPIPDLTKQQLIKEKNAVCSSMHDKK